MSGIESLRTYFEENDASVGFDDLDDNPSAVAIGDAVVEGLGLAIKSGCIPPFDVRAAHSDAPWEQGLVIVSGCGNEYEIRITRKR